MKRRISALLLGMCLTLAVPAVASASTIFINFENTAEFDPPTALGVTFTNALVLTSIVAGGSLSDDFPPNSEFNIAFDAGGAMGLTLSTLFQDFSGYFTFIEPVTVTAFKGGAAVGSVTSSLTPNIVSAGGTPNELLSLSIPGGFDQLEFLGLPGGGSFAVDDITLEVGDVVAPEPATLWLLGMGAAALVRRRARIAA